MPQISVTEVVEKVPVSWNITPGPFAGEVKVTVILSIGVPMLSNTMAFKVSEYVLLINAL
jgi:hypothetical protein